MAIRTIIPLLALVLATPASAQGFGGAVPYAPAYADSYGFASEFVRGDYIGAPLTRVPRPTEIVPSPWSYGTYGIPTVSGIAPAPTAQPSLTVIQSGTARGRRHLGAIAEDRSTGARIIAVQVPRR